MLIVYVSIIVCVVLFMCWCSMILWYVFFCSSFMSGFDLSVSVVVILVCLVVG